MPKRQRTGLDGLQHFGLTPAQLRGLGARPLEVELIVPLAPHVYPAPALFKKLLLMTPTARRASMREWRAAQLAQLIREEQFSESKTLVRDREPIGLVATVPASAVNRLLRSRHIGYVNVLSIRGRKRRVASTRRPRASERLFSVRALFVLQSEGQRRGMQWVEDRIVLMRARSELEARRRAEVLFRPRSPVMNSYGWFHRWTCEAIVDVCEPTDDKWSPRATEAYYEIRQRRMKREYEWRPGSAV
jgi:hypothetical protein